MKYNSSSTLNLRQKYFCYRALRSKNSHRFQVTIPRRVWFLLNWNFARALALCWIRFLQFFSSFLFVVFEIFDRQYWILARSECLIFDDNASFWYSQEFAIDGYMTLEWQDPRIRSTTLEGNALIDVQKAVETFWVPDIWMQSLRDFKVHHSIKDQAIFKLDNQSNIYYWQR